MCAGQRGRRRAEEPDQKQRFRHDGGISTGEYVLVKLIVMHRENCTHLGKQSNSDGCISLLCGEYMARM